MTSIFTLYHGGGASGWAAGDPAFPAARSTLLFEACSKLVAHDPSARNIIANEAFELRKGINDFADEFLVLIKNVGIDEFLSYQDESYLGSHKESFRTVASAFSRLGIYVRFIGVQLTIEEPVAPVASPEVPDTTPSVVIAALADAEALIANGNYIGAIDRIHTALHGYTRSLCEAGSLASREDAIELPRAIKLLRENHPKLSSKEPHKEHVGKILKAMGSICDSLGTIRNHGSLAHANENLVNVADALLAVNAGRTILRYFVDILDGTTP